MWWTRYLFKINRILLAFPLFVAIILWFIRHHQIVKVTRRELVQTPDHKAVKPPPITSPSGVKIRAAVKREQTNISNWTLPATESAVQALSIPGEKSSSYLPVRREIYTEQEASAGTDSPHVYGDTNCSPPPSAGELRELFREWIELTSAHNIEYTLCCGSLLGTMRDGQLIPYDSDIDVLVNAKFFPILKMLADHPHDNEDGRSHFVVQWEFDKSYWAKERARYNCWRQPVSRMEDECSFQEPMARLNKGSLHIDIWSFHENDTIIEFPYEGKIGTWHRKVDYFPPKPCTFIGLHTICPRKPWKVLKTYFKTENLEPEYKCNNGVWYDKYGKPLRGSSFRKHRLLLLGCVVFVMVTSALGTLRYFHQTTRLSPLAVGVT